MKAHPSASLHAHRPLLPSEGQVAGEAPVASFDECYERFAPTVSRWVSRLASSSMDVEDVVQEVFCVVHRKLDQWDGEGTFSTWLFRITHHVVRNWNRKRKIRRWLGFGSAEEADALDLRSEAPGPSDQLESEQAAAEVKRVLAQLSESHRTLIVLFELEELTTPQIAEMLDVKVGTVRVGLHRARAEFLKAYQRLQQEPPTGGRA